MPLTQAQANSFAQAYHTTLNNILKEHYQMIVLDRLFNSPFEERLVFKGGTALKLVYNSMRFSEDLNFSSTGEVAFDDFTAALKQIGKLIPGAALTDMAIKPHTHYARLVFSLDYQTVMVGVKLEVDRPYSTYNTTVALIRSPFNNLEIIGRVYTIASILKDKLRILTTQERREPRDLFDAWYISQKLSQPFEIKPQYKYERIELMDRLYPYLPQNARKVVELFAK